MPLEPSGIPSRAAIQAAIDEAVADRCAGLPYAEAAGTATVTLSAAASGSAAITFPPGRFTVPPLVTATITSAPAGSAKFVPRALNATVDDASVYIYTGDATAATASVTVAWRAVQMTETTAAG